MLKRFIIKNSGFDTLAISFFKKDKSHNPVVQSITAIQCAFLFVYQLHNI